MCCFTKLLNRSNRKPLSAPQFEGVTVSSVLWQSLTPLVDYNWQYTREMFQVIFKLTFTNRNIGNNAILNIVTFWKYNFLWLTRKNTLWNRLFFLSLITVCMWSWWYWYIYLFVALLIFVWLFLLCFRVLFCFFYFYLLRGDLYLTWVLTRNPFLHGAGTFYKK